MNDITIEPVTENNTDANTRLYLSRCMYQMDFGWGSRKRIFIRRNVKLSNGKTVRDCVVDYAQEMTDRFNGMDTGNMIYEEPMRKDGELWPDAPIFEEDGTTYNPTRKLSVWERIKNYFL